MTTTEKRQETKYAKDLLKTILYANEKGIKLPAQESSHQEKTTWRPKAPDKVGVCKKERQKNISGRWKYSPSSGKIVVEDLKTPDTEKGIYELKEDFLILQKKIILSLWTEMQEKIDRIGKIDELNLVLNTPIRDIIKIYLSRIKKLSQEPAEKAIKELNNLLDSLDFLTDIILELKK